MKRLLSRAQRLTPMILLMLALASSRVIAQPAPDPAADRAAAARKFVRESLPQLLEDPSKSQSLFALSTPADHIVADAVADFLISWKVFVATAEAEGKLSPTCVERIGLPFGADKELNDAEIATKADTVTIDLEETYPGTAHLKWVDGNPRWNIGAQLEIEDVAEARALESYLKTIGSAMQSLRPELGKPPMRDAKALANRLDQAVAQRLMAPYFAKKTPEPAPPAPANAQATDGIRIGERGGQLVSLAVAGGGEFVVTGSGISPTPLQVWNVRQRKAHLAIDLGLPGLPAVYDVKTSPDGKYLVAAGWFFPHVSIVELLRSAQPKDVFESLDEVPFVAIIDAQTWKVLRQVKAMQSPHSHITFSSGSKRFAISGVRGTQVWSLPDGAAIANLKEAFSDAPFLPDGTRLAARTAGNLFTTFDAVTGNALQKWPLIETEQERSLESIALSSDGSRVAFSLSGGVILADMNTQKRTRVLRFPGNSGNALNRLSSIVFSKDGNRLLGTTGLITLDMGDKPDLAAFFRLDRNHDVCVWDTNSGAIIKRFSGHSKSVTDAAFLNADETEIVSCGTDGTVRLWSMGK